MLTTENCMEVYNILNRTYKDYAMLYTPFKIEEDNTITFSCDTYFDPIFTILALRKAGILTATIRTGGLCGETDYVRITDAEVDVLQKLEPDLPKINSKNIAEILKQIDYVPEVASPITKAEGAVLMEGDRMVIISPAVWNTYWQLLGKPNGPESGWEIPTASEIYQTVSSAKSAYNFATQFSNKRKNHSPEAKEANEKKLKM